MDTRNYSGQNLQSAVFRENNLTNAIFNGAQLNAAVFIRATLESASFNGACLWIADMRLANLRRASLVNADAVGVHLSGADMRRVNAEGADFRGAKMIRISYRGVSSGTKLNNAILKNANFKDADMEGADLEGANLEGATLKGANLQGANLKRTNLKGANLRGANLKDAMLDEKILEAANYDYKQLRSHAGLTDRLRMSLMLNTISKFDQMTSKLAYFAFFAKSETALIPDVVNYMSVFTFMPTELDDIRLAKDDLKVLLDSIGVIVKNDEFWLKQADKSLAVPSGVEQMRQVLADKALSDLAKWKKIEEITQRVPSPGLFGGERKPVTSEFYKAILNGEVAKFESTYHAELNPPLPESNCVLQ